MNIGVNLIGTIRYRWGGRVYAQNVLKALAEIDKQNQYFLFLSSPKNDFFDIRQENFHRVYCCYSAEKSTLHKLLAEQIILPSALAKHRIDVLFSPCNLVPIFSRSKKVVTVHDLRFAHGFDSPLRNFFKKYLMTFVLKTCDRIIVDSQNTYQDIIKFIKVAPAKVKKIYCPINLKHFSTRNESAKEILRKYNIDEGQKYILFVSANYPWKNIHALIETFSLFKNKYHQSHKLVIIGQKDLSYTPELKKIAKELNLENEIVFTGRVEDDELPAFYQRADVFVFTSLFEGFGMPLAEAMASGVPVVAFDTTTSPEIVDSAGLLIKNGQKQEFSNAIFELINNKELKKRLVKNGLIRVKAFDPEEIGRQILKEIETVYYK